MTETLMTKTWISPDMIAKTIKPLVKPKAKKTEAAQPNAAPDAWRLIDKQDRSKLSEGRNKGLGSAFAKRSGRTLTTLDGISACKDFLAERVAAQILGEPVTMYGLTSKPIEGAYDTHAYLILGILKINRTDATYPTYDKDVAALASNYRHIQSFVNYFESVMSVDGRTVIEPISDNRYVAIIPLFWVKSTWMVSLVSLLMRAALHWDGKGDPMVWAKRQEGEDVYMMTAALPKIERIAKEGVPPQDFTPGPSYHWHSTGIVAMQWPPAKIAPAKTTAPTLVLS